MIIISKSNNSVGYFRENYENDSYSFMHYTSYDSDTLRHLQGVLSMILKDFDKICMDNGINYSVDGGTALGAIRHRGFIPWDDDVDVMMCREDYEKFRELIKASEKYELLNIEDYSQYMFYHSKLSLKGTKFQLPWNRKTDFTLGINIDIFVFDNVPNNSIQKRIYLNKLKLWTLISYLYINKLNNCHTSNLKKNISEIGCKILPIFGITPEYLKNRYSKLIDKYDSKNCDEVFYQELSEVDVPPLPKSWFSSFERVEFGDFEVNIIKEYDKYLKTLYGDYMEIPPEESKMVVAPDLIDFGEY